MEVTVGILSGLSGGQTIKDAPGYLLFCLSRSDR